MLELGAFLKVPTLNHMMWAGAVVIALFVFAMVLDAFRRRREARLRVEADWRAAREIADEKNLSEEARRELFALIRRFAPNTPMRVVTTRQEFDRCVAQDLSSVSRNHDDYEARGALLRDIREHLGLDFVPYGQRISSSRELHSGQAVWIAEGKGGAPRWRRMKVSAVDEACFRLVPGHDQSLQAPEPNTPLQCRMWRDEDARYRFTARFLRAEDTPPAWVLEHAAELIRMQSRAHFRIRLEQPCDIAVLDAPVDGDYTNLDKREAVAQYQGQLTSLSGGGFAVVMPQPMPKQALLRIQLDLGHGQEPAWVTGRIVEVTPLGASRHLVRAAFAGLPNDDRERITRYVLQNQPALRHLDDNNPAAPA